MFLFRCVPAMLMALLPAYGLAFEAKDLELAVVQAISDDHILADHRPAGNNMAPTLEFVATPGEYEPASFVVYANSPVANLQVAVTPLQDEQGEPLSGATIDIRVVKRWYQRNFGYRSNPADPQMRIMMSELLVYDDQLVKTEKGANLLRLDNGQYINISKPAQLTGSAVNLRPDVFSVRDAAKLQPVDIDAKSNKQFWATLYLPEDAPAGEYAASIQLLSGQRVVDSLPVRVEVLPFALAEPQMNYSIYYRGILDRNWSAGSISSEYKSVEQMQGDFENLAAHGIINPTVYQPYATGLLRDVLVMRQQAGMTRPRLYYLGVDVVGTKDGAVPAYLPAQTESVLATADRFGIDEVFFYARDEARGQELAYQFPYWNTVTELGGKIMAAGWQTDAEQPGNFDITGGKEDLFVSLGMARYQEARRWHAKGNEIYSYQNPTGGREIAASWRRNYGLLLWQNEYDGGMPYAWQHSYGNGWNDFDHSEYKDHNFTYPTVDGRIDTLQWEGLRESVDDVRYLSTLLELLEDGSENSPAVQEAQRWIADLKTRALAQEDLSRVRAEMTGLILSLRGEAAAGGAAITNLSVAPIEPGGVAHVSWQTAGRTTGSLRANVGGKQLTVKTAGLMHEHNLKTSGLPLGQTVPIVVSSGVGADEQPTEMSGIIDTSPALVVSGSATREGDQYDVEFQAMSQYRASVGVDWGRSLIGWWRFSTPESVGKDESTWANELDLKGDARSAEGWFGKGIALDGAGDFVNISDIEIDKNGTATIEGWFRFRSFAMDNLINMGLFSGMYQHASNNNFYFYRTNDNFEVGSLLQTNTWHHIVLSWDGNAGSAMVYIDGQQVRPTLQSKVEDVPSIDGLNIGRSTGYFGGLVGASTNTFDGSIDEIRVWSRVLSPAEVQASYAAGRGMEKIVLPALEGAATEFSIIGANAADESVVTTIE